MKKAILTITIVFLSGYLHAQYYYNGQLSLDSGNYHYRFRITEKYPKPQRNSIYYWYKYGQLHKSQGGYDGKLLDGSYSVTDFQHNLVEQGYFIKGQKSGLWKTWYPNQQIKRIIHYFTNNKIQNILAYDSTGVIIKKGTIKKRKFTGSIQESHEGKLIRIYYKRGIRQQTKHHVEIKQSTANENGKVL